MNSSQLVFTTALGQNAVFWQAPRTRKTDAAERAYRGLHPAANARRSSLLVFHGSVVGIPAGMNKLTRLRRAEQRIVKVQRRIWLAQALAWPTVIAAGATSVGVLVWFLRRQSAGNRHEMPDLPGAHEDGTVHVQPDGQLTHTSAASDAQDPLKAR